MGKNSQPAGTEAAGYTPEQCRSFCDQLRRLRNETPRVQLNLSLLAEKLTVERARRFANEGLGRRLPVVDRAVLKVFSIYPPDRQAFLGQDELSDIAIHLHAFGINVYAMFDNIAWVCMLEAGGNLDRMQIGPFKPKCEPLLPDELRRYLEQKHVRQWYDHYGKVYRDATAHRIPPHLPSRVMTHDDAALFQELHQRAEESLIATKPALAACDSAEVQRLLAQHEELLRHKEALGHNSRLIALSLTGEDYSPPVFLHPQLLCDLALVHELLNEFAKSFRKSKCWPEPNIPAMQVN